MVAFRGFLLLIALLTPSAAHARQCTKLIDELLAHSRAALLEIEDKTNRRTLCEVQTMAHEHHTTQFEIVSKIYATCPPKVWEERKCNVECMTAKTYELKKERDEACAKK